MESKNKLLTSKRGVTRRDFLKKLFTGAALAATATTPLALFPEKSEARRRSRKLEEKLKIANFYYSFHRYSKKSAEKRYEATIYLYKKVPPMIVEYYGRTNDDSLYDGWLFLFEDHDTYEDYDATKHYLDVQEGNNQGYHFNLGRAKYEPMFFNELDDLYGITPGSPYKSDSEINKLIDVKKNLPMFYYMKGVDDMTWFVLRKKYESNKTNHREVVDPCIKNFASALFEIYYPKSGKRLGDLFYHIDLDKKKEMIYDLIIPKITEHGTLDQLLEYKDNKKLNLEERRKLFIKGLVNAHNLPLENQIEYMKRLWASAAVVGLDSAYLLGYYFVNGYYQSYINKTYLEPGKMIYNNLEKPFTLRNGRKNYFPFVRGPPFIIKDYIGHKILY